MTVTMKQMANTGLSAALMQLLFLTGTSAIPFGQIYSRSTNISWGPCDLESPLEIQCATLAVPRDYTLRDANQTIDLDLLKVPAVKGPSKGSILFNFGGPGLPTRANLAERAEIYHA